MVVAHLGDRMPRLDAPEYMPQQLTFAIDRPHQQRLDNFVVGDNQELLTQLLVDESTRTEFRALWIFGPANSGRTHLMRGKCLLALERDFISVAYVGCEEFVGNEAGLLQALNAIGGNSDRPKHDRPNHGLPHRAADKLVCIDDIEALPGGPEIEEALMGVYQHVLSVSGTLLVTHSKPATALEFSLPDLNSRFRSMLHYQLSSLSDEDKAQILGKRAQARGYELSPGVLAYWMARGPRDIGTLLKDLDVLDRASLARHQRVTIPLLKQVLGY